VEIANAQLVYLQYQLYCKMGSASIHKELKDVLLINALNVYHLSVFNVSKDTSLTGIHARPAAMVATHA